MKDKSFKRFEVGDYRGEEAGNKKEERLLPEAGWRLPVKKAGSRFKEQGIGWEGRKKG